MAQVAPKRRRGGMRRLLERFVLGAVMTVIAAVVDRRLRRLFGRR